MAQNRRGWVLVNLDDNTVLEGQFEATGLTSSSGASYAQIQALNRQHPILQFVRGEQKTVRFQARVFSASNAAPSDAFRELSLLRLWVDRDEKLRRPPILSFSLGDGHVLFDQCVLLNVEESHDIRVQPDGQFRGALVSLTFAKYVPFTITGGTPTESLFHQVKRREYYEMLALNEYGDPLLGDVLRARNPTKPLLQVGDLVKMPSVRAIATEKQGPRSVPLDSAFGKQDTAQRRRLREALDNRSDPVTSFVLRA